MYTAGNHGQLPGRTVPTTLTNRFCFQPAPARWAGIAQMAIWNNVAGGFPPPVPYS